MTRIEPATQERIADLDDRDVRALTEFLTVLEEGEDLYSVTSQSGREYLVDTREGVCDCPDHEYRSIHCKHLRRVAFATGERVVPACVDGVDSQVGLHVAGEPRVAATDGGVCEAHTMGKSGEDGRPDDCECEEWMDDHDLECCWHCYRAGFRSANPEVLEEVSDR